MTDRDAIALARARLALAKRALSAAARAIIRGDRDAAARSDAALRLVNDARHELARLTSTHSKPGTVRPWWQR